MLVFVLVVLCLFAIPIIIKEVKAANARREEEAARQRAYEGEIISACNKSLTAFENIPKDLMSAEQLLDTAEYEFQDSAFSPFWDSIERAMRKIGAVDSNVKLITICSNRYKTLAKSYTGQPPDFPVDPAAANRLATARATAGRLQKTVRQAQRNFQFATIYEQRKTSEILIAGFANLGEAIYGLGSRLEESIDMLGHEINSLSSSMTENNEQLIAAVSQASGKTSSQLGEISTAIKGADASARAATSEQATRQENANKMLDNIQRHRVPPPLAEH